MKRRLEKLIYPGAYYYVVAFWIIGMALNILTPAVPSFQRWVQVAWAIPATFGAIFAARMLLTRRHYRMNERQPRTMMVDAESGTATVTLLNGEMVSIRIPDEILEEGPGAVADYCAREFEQEQ
jgi:hypothetical protein